MTVSRTVRRRFVVVLWPWRLTDVIAWLRREYIGHSHADRIALARLRNLELHRREPWRK